MIIEKNKENTIPKIVFEEMEGTILIEGRAISLEIEKYFDDFLPYLEDCLNKNPINLKVDIKLEFFSTKASLKLANMFNIIKKCKINNKIDVEINWYYELDDVELLECGEDYEEITGLKFNFIEKPE